MFFNLDNRYIKQEAITAAWVAADVGTKAAIISSAVSGAASIHQSREAEKFQRKQLEVRQRMADLQNVRQRREAIRKARVARAEAVASGEQAGATGSSAVQGATSGISSQLGVNLSFLDQSQKLSEEATIFGKRAASAQGKAATFGSISKVSGQFVDYDAITTAFNKKPGTK